MDENTIKSIIASYIDNYATKNQYGVSKIPYHVHDGIGSPLINSSIKILALSDNSATPAINTNAYSVVHITNQTAAITSFTSKLQGNPNDGDTLRISITGTAAVGITWGTSFEASTVALPTTTVLTNRLDVSFFWNTETSKWRCVASV